MKLCKHATRSVLNTLNQHEIPSNTREVYESKNEIWMSTERIVDVAYVFRASQLVENRLNAHCIKNACAIRFKEVHGLLNHANEEWKAFLCEFQPLHACTCCALSFPKKMWLKKHRIQDALSKMLIKSTMK